VDRVFEFLIEPRLERGLARFVRRIAEVMVNPGRSFCRDSAKWGSSPFIPPETKRPRDRVVIGELVQKEARDRVGILSFDGLTKSVREWKRDETGRRSPGRRST
jgi:hypothetical protein